MLVAACGELSYYGPSGVISSPNYPGDYQNDKYCDYYVYASSGSSLSFVFKSFHLESNDFVTVGILQISFRLNYGVGLRLKSNWVQCGDYTSVPLRSL